MIEGVTLNPAFNPGVTEYTATTTEASNKVTAEARDEGDTVLIKNGNTTVTNGSTASWSTGSNTLTVKVTDEDDEDTNTTYTVTVTKQ